MPFVVRFKGVLPEGKVYDQPVISLDVAATAAALAGLPQQADFDGVNLIPYLTGDKQGPPHETLYWRFWGQAAVRAGNWKYVALAGGAEYLFDLASPRHETENLIDQNPAVAERLKRTLSRWCDELHRPGLPKGELNTQEVNWYRHYLGWSE